MRLIMIGGHDPLCIENVEHLKELQELAEELNLPFVGDDAVIQFKVISIRNSINTSFPCKYRFVLTKLCIKHCIYRFCLDKCNYRRKT